MLKQVWADTMENLPLKLNICEILQVNPEAMFIMNIRNLIICLAVLFQYFFCLPAGAQYIDLSLEILSKSSIRVIERADNRLREEAIIRDEEKPAHSFDTGQIFHWIEVTAMENVQFGVEVVPGSEEALSYTSYINNGNTDFSEAISFKGNRAVFTLSGSCNLLSQKNKNIITSGAWIIVPKGGIEQFIIEYY